MFNWFRIIIIFFQVTIVWWRPLVLRMLSHFMVAMSICVVLFNVTIAIGINMFAVFMVAVGINMFSHFVMTMGINVFAMLMDFFVAIRINGFSMFMVTVGVYMFDNFMVAIGIVLLNVFMNLMNLSIGSDMFTVLMVYFNGSMLTVMDGMFRCFVNFNRPMMTMMFNNSMVSRRSICWFWFMMDNMNCWRSISWCRCNMNCWRSISRFRCRM